MATNHLEARKLHFDVSTGLKTVLGSELITDDEVTIFELVKNSFDAEATQVDLYFGRNRIVIADNGIGMSFDDIENKWLFVAYSSKRLSNRSGDFRDGIAERRNYAGSKGIGRFSSDRLGRIVKLQTRTKSEHPKWVHSVDVDWSLFDVDHHKRFDSVGVTYAIQPDGFVVPDIIGPLNNGTVITIENLWRDWDREKNSQA